VTVDPRLADCRRLFVRGLELNMRIGAHDAERHAPQRVRIDVDVWVPLAQSTPRHDRLDEVVDYGFIRDAALALVARGHVDLQETLCDNLARALLGQRQVRAVRVATDKPDVYPDCATVGVEVIHFKDPAS
jgi:dihydroneopterin aldolase